MTNEWDKVDVWVGRFPSAEAVDAYFKETYSDNDPPISQFAADMGTWFYDHDFMEYEFHEAPVADFPAALSKHSFASSYQLPAAHAFDAAPLIPFNLVLVMSGDQIDNPVSAAGPDRIMRYLGRFKCDTAAE